MNLLRRVSWFDASMGALGVAAIGSGMGQFAITAVIGDVAQEFGQPGPGTGLSDQLGLTGTTIGIALAVIRLASLGSLPASSLADRFGRRPLLLTALTVGLTLTALSALAPGFWWWVVIVAVARPWLSTTNAVTGVAASEAVRTRHRSWALAYMAAAYALGTGLVSVPRPVLPSGFRPVMLLAGLVIVLLPWVFLRLREPPIAARADHARGLPGAVPREHRGNVARMVAVAGGIAVATGPAYTYVFLYGEQVLELSKLTMSLAVLGAGPVGMVGLFAGRWMADAWGRRPGVAVGLVGGAAGFAATYQGEPLMLLGGYMFGLIAGAAMGPGLGAMSAEVFPTTVRATVAGWIAAAGVIGAVIGLALFGILADEFGFGGAATILACVSALATLALIGIPETAGMELDELPEQ